jgi:hypothetical protein
MTPTRSVDRRTAAGIRAFRAVALAGDHKPYQDRRQEQNGGEMNSAERAVLIAAYSRLVADIWVDPAVESRLNSGPRGLLGDYGLVVPDGVDVVVVRDGLASPDLEIQVAAWRDCTETGTFTLFVPPIGEVGETSLDEDELDSVVAGLDTTCACCCPCCCT